MVYGVFPFPAAFGWVWEAAWDWELLEGACPSELVEGAAIGEGERWEGERVEEDIAVVLVVVESV